MGALNTFPLSYKVKGKRIVIVGGDAEALAKARLAVKTAGDVRVFSPEVLPEFHELPVEVEERRLQESDLEGAALVFVARHDDEGDRAERLARARGIPVNVVDVPGRCDFFTPAIVDRAPLSIAISSEGEAPVLARLVRARIEAMFSPKLGKLATLAGSLREKVSERFASGDDRRRFYEALVTDPRVDGALDLGVSRAWQEGTRLLDVQAKGAGEGVVWLIGAGPGAEDLLTLRAQRLLQEADVIVHDQLVPELVVQMGRRDAERIKVGKQKGHHSFSQAQINTLIVRLARQGKKVARLKSGDPMIFGRAGEEIAALREAGVSYQIVPGVTAALAAAADTATPVTLRKVSSGFVVATAHGAEECEIAHWAALARQGITLGIYMGKSVAGMAAGKLMGEGLGPETPVGVVVNAGRMDKQLFAGSLGDLAAGAVDFGKGPALILIGEAVKHGDWDEAVALAGRAEKAA